MKLVGTEIQLFIALRQPPVQQPRWRPVGQRTELPLPGRSFASSRRVLIRSVPLCKLGQFFSAHSAPAERREPSVSLKDHRTHLCPQGQLRCYSFLNGTTAADGRQRVLLPQNPPVKSLRGSHLLQPKLNTATGWGCRLREAQHVCFNKIQPLRPREAHT